MNHLPQISEEQRWANIRKLINQNKKLQSEIFLFEQQINKIVSNFTQEQKTKMEQSQARRTSSRQRRSQSSFGNTTLHIKMEKGTVQQDKNTSTLIFDQQAIQKLLESNSPLIQTKVIPSLKDHVEYLKSLNIKENVHYILKEEDELKIVKKELYRLRKEKQVVTDFIKDKTVKLQKQNNQLTNHKNSLKQQLGQTIKLNRQSATAITQLQRQIRKYHLMLYQYKRLSQSTLPQGKDKTLIEKIKTNPSAYLQEMDKQYLQLKLQIATIEAKWKQQLDASDKQYYQLKEELEKKELQEKTITERQVFHKTRILVMKDQDQILLQKQKKSLVKASPKLQKQLQEYLKDQQQKLRKKQQYLKKHRPRDKDEQQYQKILIKSAAKSPNPQNTVVETSHNDKNIVKLKSYLRPKQKVDKQTQAKIKKLPENHRMERSWSQTQEELSLEAKNSQINLINKDKEKREKAMPKIMLKSIKLGTTFHNQSQEDDH